MRIFALIVFGLHVLAEGAFGLMGFLSGAYSSLPLEQMTGEATQLRVSARFQGAALMALAAVGLVAILGPGVQSATGRALGWVLAGFHGVGIAGIGWTAMTNPEILDRTHTHGALVIHGVLLLGFLIVLVGAKRTDG